MEFDGNNDYLRIPDTSALYFGSNDFTVSFWVLKDTTSASTFGQIYFIGPNSNNGWGIYMDGSKQYLEISTTGSNETVSYASTPITAMNTGQWYHFDFVRNGGYLYTYRDTVLINSTNIGAITVYNSTKPIDFGVTSDSNATPTGYYHDGKLDDIRIYNRALSTKEIQQLYGQGR